MPDEEPRIIIDEDWKARVQRERDEAARKAEEAEKGEHGEAQEESEAEDSPFLGLVRTLSMQTMLALGILAPRDAKEVVIDVGQAKWLIDVLMALREKTRGNLTPVETGELTETLAELQRGYLLRAQQAQEAALKNPSIKTSGAK